MHSGASRPTGPRLPLGTPQGERRIRLTLGLSVLAAMATAGMFVAVGGLIDDGVRLPLVLA
ncbi:hypothetical protein ACFQ06_06505, partial [Tessaracoccus lubricantis]